MALETKIPDALLVQSNLTGAVTDIDDDPDSPDGLWLAASSNNSNSNCVVSFGTPTGNPRTGSGLQSFKWWARLTANGTACTYNVYLLESGTRINGGTAIATGSLTSTVGQLITATWDASLLGTADGSAVEAELEVIKSGGPPTARTAGEVGAVEWNVDYSEAGTAFERIVYDELRIYDTKVPAFYDNFNRSDANSPGAPWVQWTGVSSNWIGILGNKLGHIWVDSGGAGVFVETPFGSDATPNQYASAEIWFSMATSQTWGGAQLNLRGNNTGPGSDSNFWCYTCPFTGTDPMFQEIGWRMNAAETIVTTAVFGSPIQQGDRIGFTAVGTGPITLTGWWNNTPVQSFAIQTPTLVVGSYMAGVYLSQVTSLITDNFEAGVIVDPYWLLFEGGTAFTRAIADSLGLTDSEYRIVGYGRKLTETIGVADTVRTVKAMIRYLADVEGRTDSARRQATFFRYVADQKGITDEEWRRVSWNRYFSDPLGFTDAQAQAKGQQRNLTEALGIADVANRYFGATRRQADSIGITDILSRRQDFVKQLSEALGVSDQAVRAVVFGRQATEALGFTDSRYALKLLLRTLAEGLGITDARLKASGFARIFSDTLGYADAQNRASALARGLTEALGITDAQARKVAFSREVRDAIGIGDARGVLKLLIRVLADQFGITDAQTRQAVLGRIVAEAIGLTDARARTMALGRILADVESISDASLRQVSFYRTLTEALGIDDRESVLKVICRAIADAVGITDYRDMSLGAPSILVTIAETLSISDALTATKLAIILRTISENLGITDARWAARAVRRILSDALGITDVEDETKQIKRYLTELIDLSDDVEKASAIIRRLTETAGITDAAVESLAAYIIRIISDEVGLTDRVSKLSAILTWLALTIAVGIPAVRSEMMKESPEGGAADSEVYPPAIKSEVE